MTKDVLKLCLITHPDCLSFDNYVPFILQAIKGGVTLIQLRNKIYTPHIIRTLAIELLSALRPLNIPLIINDDVILAKEVDADGVHLGQSDISPFAARNLLGPNKMIGWSIETMKQLEQANRLGCIDYVAASAIFPSKTKQNCKTIWGLHGLESLSQKSTHPIVAIGGVHAGNCRNIIHAGACGVAVISAIHESTQPECAAKQLIQEINKGSTNVSTN